MLCVALIYEFIMISRKLCVCFFVGDSNPIISVWVSTTYLCEQ